MTFVVLFFAKGDGDFDFHLAFFEIEFCGDERGSFRLAFSDKRSDFFSVQKKFSRSGRIIIAKVSRMYVGRNVGVGKVEFRIFDGYKTVFNANMPRFYGAHFVTEQNNARFIKRTEKIIERRTFVDSLNFHTKTVAFFENVRKGIYKNFNKKFLLKISNRKEYPCQ